MVPPRNTLTLFHILLRLTPSSTMLLLDHLFTVVLHAKKFSLVIHSSYCVLRSTKSPKRCV